MERLGGEYDLLFHRMKGEMRKETMDNAKVRPEGQTFLEFVYKGAEALDGVFLSEPDTLHMLDALREVKV